MSSVALSPDTDRDAWLAARRRGIGASEIAAVLGISPWESPFSLYWRKREGWDFEVTPEMEWGLRLEPAVAAKYEDVHHADRMLGYVGLVVGAEPWMLATPDRHVYELPCAGYEGAEPRVFGLLELKTGHSAAEGWGEPGTAEIPVYYRSQVLWQMLCTGLSWVDVAVLIGGSDYREYTVLRDDKDIAVMVEHGRRFMARIAAGDPPPIDDHHATLTTLKRLHPDLDDADAEVDDRTAANYLRACRAYKLAEKAKDRYEAQLRAQMGRAKRATTAGRKVATRTVVDIAGSTVIRNPYRRDYLTPAKEKKP